MRLNLLIILLFSVFISFTQEDKKDIKYPSLLWEISGNGLNKSSYLYGTMHVSEKVAYHLSDAFFEKVLETDAIALETNPELWLDGMQDLPDFYTNLSFDYSNSFYQSFATQPLNKQDLIAMYFLGEQFINGILYRKTDSRTNYEESTYLDMFLYQIGSRTQREVISLEDFKESHNIVMRAEMNNVDRQPSAWFKEKTQEKSYDVLLTDAYRDKNLDLIDSLNIGMNTKEYIDLMLVLRNKNMVASIVDSFSNNKSVFAGVGAAHLPGEGGMIELLRAKGYTVEPIHSDYSDFGKTTKDDLEKKYISKSFQKQTLPDNSLSILSPSKLYDLSVYGVGLFYGLDLPNSSFLCVIKAPRRDYLRNDTHRYNLESLDSLFFENIPGDILEKKQITINGFDGWDIKNRTADGNRQHYTQILTPLELITILYNGNEDFIDKYEDKIFSNIEIKEMSNEWEKISPFQKGFSLELPAFYTINNNSEFTSIIAEPIIEAYDPSNQSNYFVIQKALNDYYLLEDTNFELERIAYKYLDNLKVDTLNSYFKNEKQPEFYTSGKLVSGDTIRLKTFSKGNHYYLMGSTGNKEQFNRFFNSFEFDDFNYFKDKIVHRDSTMHFTVKTNIEVSQAEMGYRNSEEEDDAFDGEEKTRIFSSESKQNISVFYEKFHKYEYYPNVDSLWEEVLSNAQTRNSFAIKDENRYQKDGWNILEATYIDTANHQSIKSKYLQKGARLYNLRSLVERDYQGDPFIEDFYNSFTPIDTILGPPLFKEKASLFFEDIKSEKDSIRKSAWKSIHYVDFDEQNLLALKSLFVDYEFEDEFEEHEISLISSIGRIENDEAYKFLEQIYRNEKGKSDIQLQILLSYAYSKNPEKYRKILELMEYDLPLPSSVYRIGTLFINLKDNVEESKVLFPDIFQFYSVSEYKDHVASFTKTVLDSTNVKKKQKKALKKTLLTNAKLELKRARSSIEQSKRNQYYNRHNSRLNDLNDYISLMFHYRDEQDVKQFLNDLEQAEEEEIQLLIIDKKLEFDEMVHLNKIQDIVKDTTFIYDTYSMLYDRDKTNLIGAISEEQIALSKIIDINRIDVEKDSIKFDKMLEVKSQSEDEEYRIFFYEVKKDSEYEEPTWQLAFIGFAIDEQRKINPKLLKNGGYYEFYNEKDRNEIYKNSIDEVLHSNRKRASFYRNYY